MKQEIYLFLMTRTEKSDIVFFVNKDCERSKISKKIQAQELDIPLLMGLSLSLLCLDFFLKRGIYYDE